MLLHLLTVAFTAQDGPPNDCFSWCLPSLLGPTASAIPGVAPPASDEAAKRILGASAKSIGDVGEYLDCVRITNGTHEPIAAYALARFSLPLGGATASPTAGASQHYGCCVPKACGAEELERGFRVTLPSKLKSATETAAKTGAALDAIAAAIDGLPRNSSFSAAAAALRRDAATANQSHMPRAAAALSAAAQGAEQAAHADTALRAAAAAAAAQNKTAAAAALRAADELLRRGPGGGWMNALEKEREKLEAQAAALNASAAALAALSSAVSAMQFDVTVGSQRAGLGGAGWAWVVLAGALLTLAAAGTAVDVAAQRYPPGGGKPPSPSGAEAHTRPLCAASCAPSAPLAPTAVEPLRAPPPPGGENGGGGASLLPADDAEGGADLSNSSSRSSSPAQRMGACNIGPRGSGAFDFRDDSAPSARPPARQGSGGAASGGGRGEEPLGVALLRCFSLVRNWRSLGSLRADGTMGCLDGMRCFSMAWVIFGHTIVYAMGAGGLQFDAELLPPGWADKLPPSTLASFSLPPEGGRLATAACQPVSYQLVPAAFFAVDTFFWLSGLLTTHALLPSVRKAASAGKAWWSAYPMYALGRWMRLSPLVGVLLLTTVGLLPALGDGPMWSLGGAEGDACRAGGWWLNLLYVQNLFALAAPDSALWRCEGHLWYLANDMQFFLAAPLFAYPLVTRPAAGWALLASALTASTAANAVIAAVNGYAASPLFDQTYFTNVYIQPWTRAQPFLVGAAFAAFWDRLQGGAAPLARRHSPASAASHARRADPAWLVWGLAAGAAAVMLALSFGTLGLYSALPSPWSEAQNVSYIALSRLGWPVGLSAVAYLCFSGQAPLVNGLLSWWPLQVFGKLTFAAYIVHPVVMYGVNYSTTAPIEFSDIWFAKSFTGFLAWASLLALLLWLLAEKPAANLLALALGRLGLKG